MKNVPPFLRGPFKNALKLALKEATWSNSRDDEVRQVRKWKLLMLLPHMLLHRPPGRGLILRANLAFSRGEWVQSFRTSSTCDEKASSARQRQWRRRESGDDMKRRASRAESEMDRRPPRPREALLRDIMEFQAQVQFRLDEKMFVRNLQSARREFWPEPMCLQQSSAW